MSLNLCNEVIHSSDGVQTHNIELDSEEVYESKVKKQGDKEENMQQKCIFGKTVQIHRKNMKQVSQDIKTCNRGLDQY